MQFRLGGNEIAVEAYFGQRYDGEEQFATERVLKGKFQLSAPYSPLHDPHFLGAVEGIGPGVRELL